MGRLHRRPPQAARPNRTPTACWPLLTPTQWVRVYDPEKAWNGYTLAFFKRRIPILMAMNGRIVHAWPEARVKSRIRLLEDGSLLGIALGRRVVEYDWAGNLTWDYRLENKIPHHDVIRLANGNTMILYRPVDGWTDTLLEVNPDRQVVWEWRADEHHLGSYFAAAKRGDVTHVNSVQELPSNPWFQKGDERFRPGNLLGNTGRTTSIRRVVASSNRCPTATC